MPQYDPENWLIDTAVNGLRANAEGRALLAGLEKLEQAEGRVYQLDTHAPDEDCAGAFCDRVEGRITLRANLWSDQSSVTLAAALKDMIGEGPAHVPANAAPKPAPATPGKRR